MTETPRAGCRPGGRLICLLVIAMWAVPAGAHGQQSSKPIDEHLQVVLQAGIEGTNAAAVAQAWQQLAQQDMDQLPVIIAALDQANPVAANWISSAIDGLIQQQLAAGHDLPKDKLVALVRDSSHSLRARQIAWELVKQADAAAAERMIPEFLHDPSAGFRRPAIEQLIQQAKAMDSEQQRDQQMETYQRALQAARDEDQVMQIAAALKELGQTVNVPAHFGYLMKWQVIGPFDNQGDRGFDEVYPPESLNSDNFRGESGIYSDQPVPGRDGEVKWKTIETTKNNGDVDFNEAIGKLKEVVAYGAAEFQSDRRQQVELRFRSQNAFKVWLNGELLMAQPISHTGNFFDQYWVSANLKEGVNLIVVKSCQIKPPMADPFFDTWHLCVRVCDSTGGALASVTQPSSNPPAEPKGR